MSLQAFVLISIQLPAGLRTAYCDLIVRLFVDVDPNVSALERVNLTFDYGALTDQPGASMSMARVF